MENSMQWTSKDKLKLLSGGVIITISVYLIFKYIFYYISPFVLAYGTALIIEKPVNSLSKLCRGKKTIASTVLVIVLAVAFFGLAGYLMYLGAGEIKDFIKNFDYYSIIVQQRAAKLSYELDGWFGLEEGKSMDFLEDNISKYINMIGQNGTTLISKIFSISVPALIKFSVLIAGFVVGMLSVIYLSNRLEPIRNWRKNTIFHEEVEAVCVGLRKLFHVYFRVQLLIMAINATVCMIGMFVLGNSYALIIGCVIGFVDALPFFGTGTILIPWAVIDILSKNYKGAAVIIIIYVITYFTREIMESKCMGDKLAISPFVLLMVIFIGIMVYGILGFILGPVSYVIIKALIDTLKIAIERGKLEKVS